MKPLAAVSELLGVRSKDVGELVAESALSDHVVVVDLRTASEGEYASWARFLKRITVASEAPPYWAVLAVTQRDVGDSPLAVVDGRQLITRLDARVWAGLRLPSELAPPVDALTEALAVELGGQDLGFISSVVASGYEACLDPKHYLFESWRARHLEGMGDGSPAVFERAAWRAQLQALFPWLEELRQRIVSVHGKRLVIDEVQSRMGVEDVGQIELGSIARQLSGKVPVQERDYLWSLAKVRNALAHSRLAPPVALDAAIKMARRHR